MRRVERSIVPSVRPFAPRVLCLSPVPSPLHLLRATSAPLLSSHFKFAPVGCIFPRFLHQSRYLRQQIEVAPPVDADVEPILTGINRTDPAEVARAILNDLQAGAPQGVPTKQLAARLKVFVKDLKQGEGVGRAMFAVSRELGLRTAGRLLPLIYSSQEKGSVNRLAYLMLTLAHASVQAAGTAGGKAVMKDRTKAVAEITNGVVEHWEVEEVVKLLRTIPRSAYFSLAEGREHQPDRRADEWSPRELGELVGQLRHDRAMRRDLEFYMDLLVKLLTSPEKDGGWGKEKTIPSPLPSSPPSPAETGSEAKRKDALKSNKPIPAYDLDYVPKVVGPALGPFFDYWGNQDYATVIHCLITAFSQHAVSTYGQHTVNKELYHEFCVEMMAQTAIAAKPTVGMLHYMINDVTGGWQESEVDELSARLEARMKPHSFFRRWFRKLFNQPTPN